MVKKTFKTLKKKPTIIILMLIPFIWNLGIILLTNFGVLQPETAEVYDDTYIDTDEVTYEF